MWKKEESAAQMMHVCVSVCVRVVYANECVCPFYENLIKIFEFAF